MHVKVFGKNDAPLGKKKIRAERPAPGDLFGLCSNAEGFDDLGFDGFHDLEIAPGVVAHYGYTGGAEAPTLSVKQLAAE